MPWQPLLPLLSKVVMFCAPELRVEAEAAASEKVDSRPWWQRRGTVSNKQQFMAQKGF